MRDACVKQASQMVRARQMLSVVFKTSSSAFEAARLRFKSTAVHDVILVEALALSQQSSSGLHWSCAVIAGWK